MRKRALLIFLSAMFCVFASCDNGATKSDSSAVSPEGWELVWSDEFDATELNAEYWTCMLGDGSDYGIPGWGNNEAQYYTDNNVSLKDGNLVITAKRENMGGKEFTSARIRTAGKVSTRYGRVEARIALPAGTGLWPAFWMLPESSTPYGSWPYSGEIDIMEARGRDTSYMSGALHYGGPSDVYKSNTCILFGSSTEEFHVYAIEWSEAGIDWYADDEKFMSVKASGWFSMADEDSELAPFDVDFHILLNLAVGGNFDGGRMPSSDFTRAEMLVDYVRIYRDTEI